MKKKILKNTCYVLGVILSSALIAGGAMFLLHKFKQRQNVIETGNVLGVSWYNETDKEFTIDTTDELYELAKLSTHYNFKGQTIKLGADIVVNEGNAEDWEQNAPSRKWTPINGFAGIFDGQGHSISGLYAKGYNVPLALFTHTARECKLQNFKVTNSYFEGRGFGGVASIVSNGGGSLKQIYSDARVNVTGVYSGYAAGLCSKLNATANLEECWFDGVVQNTGRNTGGIVDDVIGSMVTLKHCLFSGEIHGTWDYSGTRLGGLVGRAVKEGAILSMEDCLSSGTITAKANAYTGVCLGTAMSGTVLRSNNTFGASGEYGVIGTSGTQGDIQSQPLEMEPSNLIGEKAYQWTSLDFENYWSIVEGETPILKCFAENSPSLDGIEKAYDISWYDEEASEGVITNLKQLYGFYILSGNTNYEGKTVKLGADIAINEGKATSWSKNAPENKWYSINGFKGNFDGQGHTISGMYINTAKRYVGFFATTEPGSSVQNFKLKNSIVINLFGGTRALTTGSIAGVGHGTFKNIYSNAIMDTAGIYMGGLFGQVYKDTTISDCWYDGKITHTGRYAGGLIGLVSGATVNVEHCLNTGTLEFTWENAYTNSGGLIGATMTNDAIVLNITDCLNVGTVNCKVGGLGSILGHCVTGTVNIKNTYALKGSNAKDGKAVGHNQATVNGGVITLNKEFLTGYSAFDWTALDFEKHWSVVLDDTPILKKFASKSPSVAGRKKAFDTSWYNEKKSSYTLTDAKDLYGLTFLSVSTDFSGKTIKLGASITLNDNAATTKLEWFPISEFAGTLDGQGHTIEGLYISSGGNAGLFSKTTDTAIVKNLTMKGASITATEKNAGTIAGQGGGTFANITVDETSTVNASAAYAGGLVGFVPAENKIVIKACTTNGTVATSSTSAGGFIGEATKNTDVTITNCVSNGTITAVSDKEGAAKVGGFLGASGTDAKIAISECKFSGGAKALPHTNGIVYLKTFGGIIGMVYSSDPVTIDKCLVEGSVSAHSVVGGMIGLVQNANKEKPNKVAITDCHVTGTLSNISKYVNNVHLGGLVGNVVGQSETNTATVQAQRCLLTGKIEMANTSKIYGGILVGCVSNYGVFKSTDTYYVNDATYYTLATDDEGSYQLGYVFKDAKGATLDVDSVQGVSAKALKTKAKEAIPVLFAAVEDGNPIWAAIDGMFPTLRIFQTELKWVGEGTGTKEDPYRIANQQQLKDLATIVEVGYDFIGKYIRLIPTKVEQDGTKYFELTEAHTPIGTASVPFNGIFDGDNCVITGLNVDGESELGMFGVTGNEAEFKNFTVQGAKVAASGGSVGTVVGQGGGTFNNITIDANSTVSSEGTNAAGLIGCVPANGVVVIENCNTNGTVNSKKTDVGGLIGKVSENAKVTIADSTSDATVNGSGKDVGGFIGKAYGNTEVTITGCESNATVTSSASGGEVGGILGACATGATINISKTSFTGSVNASAGAGKSVGGMIGILYQSSATITECLVSGTVEANQNVGGLVGFVQTSANAKNSLIDIDDCHITGTVKARAGGEARTGALVGYAEDKKDTDKITNKITIDVARCLMSGSLSNSSKTYKSVLVGKMTNQATLTCTEGVYYVADDAKLNVNKDEDDNYYLFQGGTATLNNVVKGFSASDLKGPNAFDKATALGTVVDAESNETIWVTSPTSFPTLRIFYKEWNGEGEGTQADPYLIEGQEQLQELAELVQSGQTFDGKYFRLEPTKVEGDTKFFELTEEHTPIGGTTAFNGTFDGNGCVITGLIVKGTNNSGLFGYTGNSAVIKNFTVKGALVTPTGQNIGIIAGKGDGTFMNITIDVDSKIEAKKVNVGGIIGQVNSNVTIRDCNVYGTISSTNADVGGIVGKVLGNATAVITGCKSNATVTSSHKSGKVGGILGSTATGANVNISKTAFTGSVNASAGAGVSVGGMIGILYQSSATITECLMSGTVEANQNVGGLVGMADADAHNKNCALTIEDCHITGTVKARAGGEARTGALVGLADDVADTSKIINKITINVARCLMSGNLTNSSTTYKSVLVGKMTNQATLTCTEGVYYVADDAKLNVNKDGENNYLLYQGGSATLNDVVKGFNATQLTGPTAFESATALKDVVDEESQQKKWVTTTTFPTLRIFAN